MEQVRSNGEQKELRDEIVDLGTRYGIVTPYTSYLAVENEPQSLNLVTPQPTTTRPSRGLSGFMIRPPKDAPAPVAGNATVDTGAAAVQQSKQMRAMKEVASLESDDTRRDAVKRVGGKTFYLIEGVWTDSEFKTEAKLPETVLKFGSDEYFDLLKQHPQLASYFALSERVVVVFEGRVYRVNGSA
jgi:Ca-activated chloride channel family protein